MPTRDARTQKPPAPPDPLLRLGLFGWTGVGDAILAALVLGDPLLLIGGPGAAKTMLAERLARAMRLAFWPYDASKAMFEDIVGFPDPRAMNDGRIGYLKTPLTLWGKQMILVDELSRATVGMQNKWLEVIGSHRIMGMDLPDLRVIVAAMNPAGLLGTSPLDDALAGRFTFLVDVPELHQMSAADQRAIIENRAATDARGLGDFAEADLPDLAAAIGDMRGLMPWAGKAVGPAATDYVQQLAASLAAKEIYLDGRRVGMIRRALVALAAVHRAQGRLPATLAAPPVDLFRHGLDVTLPFRASGRTVSRIVIDSAHHHAASALKGVPARPLQPANLLAATRDLLAGREGWDDAAVSMLVTRVAAAIERPAKVEPSLQAGAALALLAGRPDVLARVRPDARHRILQAWRDMASIPADKGPEFAGRSLAAEAESRLAPAALAAILRIGFQLATRLNALPSVNCNFEDFAPKLLAMVEEEVAQG